MRLRHVGLSLGCAAAVVAVRGVAAGYEPGAAVATVTPHLYDGIDVGLLDLKPLMRASRLIPSPPQPLPPAYRLMDWISSTATGWSLPYSPLGRLPPAPPVPVQVISQVAVACRLNVPLPEERW